MPGVVWWNGYSPEHRVDLSCSAISTEAATLVFDPIPAALDFFESSLFHGLTLCFTSGNHQRIDNGRLEGLGLPVWVPVGSGLSSSRFTEFLPNEFPFPGWCAFPLSGGGPGETAYFLAERSLMVFGDAVIHLPQRGLELLPPKYCSDAPALRTAVLKLASEAPFQNALFAHGSPLIGNAGLLIRDMARRMDFA